MRTLILALAASLVALSAQATTYVSSHAVGTGSVQLSITTDDTLGVLEEDNIVDWTISMTNLGTTFTLLGPASGDNSRIEIDGNAFKATATDLTFDFSAAGALVLFQSTGLGRELYCLQGAAACFDNGGGAEFVSPVAGFTGSARVARIGEQGVAAVAVPEPASWGLMLVGFAGLGALLRARRSAAVAA
jgi:hypothetical protein